MIAKRSNTSRVTDSAVSSAAPTDPSESREDLFKRVLVAIETLTGDDACEEWSMSNANRAFRGDKKTMYERLMRIYELSHAFNPDHSCHHVHENWRQELDRFNGAEPVTRTESDSEKPEKKLP